MKLLIWAVSMSMAMQVSALESVKLKDSISQGVGLIDLFEPNDSKKIIDGITLEAYRQNNNGYLVFAVDINEAASGTEKAQSQGVSIKTAYLTFVENGITRTYSDFETPTATMVAELGQTNRQEYFTLIGETGSSRITPSTDSELYGSSFDSTLSIRVPDNVMNVSSAVLTVELLHTNTDLGDPEAFYDFTAGFEDMAIITDVDKVYLETLSIGVDEAPLVIAKGQVTEVVDSWVYYPSSDSYFVVSYEDKYPERGDYDFNDLVVGYRVGFGLSNNQVTSIIATGYMIARGAAYSHDWYLHVPMSEQVQGSATLNLFEPESESQVAGYPKVTAVTNALDFLIYRDTKSLMSVAGSQFANTEPDVAAVKGHKFSFAVNLDTPIPMNAISAPPYDPYLFTEVTGYEIHLPGNTTRLAFSTNSGMTDVQYKDAQGYPYTLVFPEDWLPPLEQVDLGDAYGQFLDYSRSASSESVSWYLNPEPTKTKNIDQQFWKW